MAKTKNSKTIIIGIDGGGSRTRGVLYYGDQEAARRETGTARVGSVGVVESSERLLNLIRELCSDAAVDATSIDAVGIGLAGVWLAEEKQRSEQLLHLFARERKIGIENMVVTSDAAIALEGAFQGASGIVLIVGTGTIAIGKTPAGDIVRCGGWGIELSDEGSGAWIGREGLTALCRSFDGRGRQTLFAERMIHFFPIIDPEQARTLVAAFNEKVFDYASVAPVVMDCAEQGDEVCREIIERAADCLLENITVLFKRHFDNAAEVPVACLGGIMESDTILARIVADRLAGLAGLVQTAPAGLALDGALSLARNLLKEQRI